MNTYDIGIIGAGVAGSFAVLKLALQYPNCKAIVFDMGRPPMKRRHQLEGWLGCLPNSDGKLYLSDLEKVNTVLNNKTTKSNHKWIISQLENVCSPNIIKDRSPLTSLDKKIKKHDYQIQYNDFIQLIPKDIHTLSKYIVDKMSDNKNFSFSFDNLIQNIRKENNEFIITDELNEEYKCKKLLISTGRSGWRWLTQLYKDLGLIERNDIAKYGIRIEGNSSSFKDLNKSSCTLSKGDIEIGPFNWYGTVIPEDHISFAISNFRSNENRWKSEKVSFNFIKEINITNGSEETDRIGELTFILGNSRICREKISTLINRKSKISIIPEYDWLVESLQDFSQLFPEIITKCNFHFPTILPLPPKVELASNLETNLENLFLAGEATGQTGLLTAAITGASAIDFMCQ